MLMNNSKQTPRKIKVGIVSNEFFDLTIGRMGGFGWLAREAALCLKATDVFEPSFLSGELNADDGRKSTVSNGVPLFFSNNNWPEYVETINALAIDVLLTIDYRPDYDFPIAALPNVPIVMWVQDPRPQDDIDKVNSLQIPKQEAFLPGGIEPIDCTPLKKVVEEAEETGRNIIYASPAPQLGNKVKGTYGLTLSPSAMHFLPYPLNINPGEISKSTHPRVVFLGRLDPIKRPWIFIELARLFPEVEFCVLGKAHFQGDNAWNASDIPENVKFLGHVDGEAKQQLLSSAWILINPSIHEALPVSFLEALLYEMPIVSCQNPEGLVAEFGYYTGRFDGDGLASLPEFAKGLNGLLNDPEKRRELGKKGRQWVDANHTQKKFISALKVFYEQSDQNIAEAMHANRTPKAANNHPTPWGIPELLFSYYQLKQEIDNQFSADDPFILVDKSNLPVSFPKHKAISFVEQDGHYWGLPVDDKQAINEIEMQRKNGATSIVFPWTSFWMLDHYKEMRQYLNENYLPIRDTASLIIYDLSGKNPPSQV
jgi:glycosyltransferase involved in cell wall biosynthesis